MPPKGDTIEVIIAKEDFQAELDLLESDDFRLTGLVTEVDGAAPGTYRIFLTRNATTQPTVNVEIGQLVINDLTIDFNRYQAMIGYETIPLTPQEFNTLAILSKRAGTVVSHQEIISQTHQGLTYTAQDARDTVKTLIHRIRKKLVGSQVRIVTRHGFGYMLKSSRELGDSRQ